jgi:hypothetical protein
MAAKELYNNELELFEKFVVDYIITKLPPLLLEFSTSLKASRQKFSVIDLIATLGIEEKEST